MIKEDIAQFFETKHKILTLLAIFVSIFIYGILGFTLLKGVPLSEALSLTLEIFAFDYELEEGFVRAFQLSLLVFGVIFLWFALWTSLDVVLEGHFNKYFKEVNMMKEIKRLKNHYVICGGGRVGLHAAELLHARKIPFLIVEKRDYLVREPLRLGYKVLEGDALEESMLKEACVDRAIGLIAVLPETEKNILVILTAKELNPKIVIYARCSHQEHVKRLKKAGADMVFLPELACAEEIVQNITNKGEPTLPVK
ncbi:MAG: NAD(P)-binding protein [Nanoarchaeota archaeon]